MKKILMFTMASCPHCRRAHQMMEELRAKNPGYNDLEVEIVDEVEQPDLANQYDYYYVPTFYVDGEKLHEGVPSYESIENVFKKAYEG